MCFNLVYPDQDTNVFQPTVFCPHSVDGVEFQSSSPLTFPLLPIRLPRPDSSCSHPLPNPRPTPNILGFQSLFCTREVLTPMDTSLRVSMTLPHLSGVTSLKSFWYDVSLQSFVKIRSFSVLSSTDVSDFPISVCLSCLESC